MNSGDTAKKGRGARGGERGGGGEEVGESLSKNY